MYWMEKEGEREKNLAVLHLFASKMREFQWACERCMSSFRLSQRDRERETTMEVVCSSRLYTSFSSSTCILAILMPNWISVCASLSLNFSRDERRSRKKLRGSPPSRKQLPLLTIGFQQAFHTCTFTETHIHTHTHTQRYEVERLGII